MEEDQIIMHLSNPVHLKGKIGDNPISVLGVPGAISTFLIPNRSCHKRIPDRRREKTGNALLNHRRMSKVFARGCVSRRARAGLFKIVDFEAYNKRGMCWEI